MTFLTPGFAWGFLSLALITALYLLRRRYLPRQVPSTFLWQRSLKDTEANRPFQRLRKNLMPKIQSKRLLLMKKLRKQMQKKEISKKRMMMCILLKHI